MIVRIRILLPVASWSWTKSARTSSTNRRRRAGLRAFLRARPAASPCRATGRPRKCPGLPLQLRVLFLEEAAASSPPTASYCHSACANYRRSPPRFRPSGTPRRQPFPASADFSTKAICASLNFDAFMELSASPSRDHKWKIPVPAGPENREHVSGHLTYGNFERELPIPPRRYDRDRRPFYLSASLTTSRLSANARSWRQHLASRPG